MPVPRPKSPLVPSFEVRIGGSALSVEAQTHVVGVTVDDDIDMPAMFTLRMAGSDEQAKEIPWVDDEALFSLGGVVEIRLGYGDERETLVIGEIAGLEPEFAQDRLPALTVRGFSRLHRLLRGRKTRTFLQQKDSDLAATLASDAGLTARAEDSQVVHEYVYQHNQTDLEFLLARARRIGYEVRVEDKTLFFRPVANAQGETLTLRLPGDLLEFSARLSSAGQVTEVNVRGWNPKDKKEIVGQAKAGDEVSKMGGQRSAATQAEGAFGAAPWLEADFPLMSQAEADQVARARLNQVALAFITGEGVCWGRTDLRAGTVVKIEGVGQRFSGQYYVTSASHRYGPRGYFTHFTVRRNAS